MRHYHIFILLLNLCINCTAQDFDWKSNTSPSYVELIEFYKKCAKENKSVELYNMGNSDAGIPIYLCIYNGAGDSLKTFQKARKSTTLLVNNAIHAGEPDGVNASAMWLLNLMHQKSNTNDPLIGIIPAYNVGGMLNRNSWAKPQNLPVTVVPAGGHFFHGQLPQLRRWVHRHVQAMAWEAAAAAPIS